MFARFIYDFITWLMKQFRGSKKREVREITREEREQMAADFVLGAMISGGF